MEGKTDKRIRGLLSVRGGKKIQARESLFDIIRLARCERCNENETRGSLFYVMRLAKCDRWG